MRLDHVSFLKLAIPFILASITTPLLGAAGTAVVGHLGNVDFIGAVALGAVIFNTLYWMFNFLRIVTASYSSQALGRGDAAETALALLRPGVIALAVGLMMILASPLIGRAAMWLFAPEEALRDLALGYFRILIWGAPLMLGGYVLLGWLMGQMRLKAVLFLQIAANLFNCLLNVVFVFGLKMDVAGVALATLISQAGAFAAGLGLVAASGRFRPAAVQWRSVFQRQGFSDLMSTNFYLWARTGCLMIMTNIFMARSAGFGAATLAANAILFQLQYIMGDVFDGLANASGVYSGLAVGRNDRALFRTDMRHSGFWGLASALVACVVYLGVDTFVLRAFTDLPEVLATAGEYSIYVALYPLAASIGVVYSGLFNGALKTRPVCVSMALALALFLAGERSFVPLWANHGLWLAFLIFYVGRSGFLLMFMPALTRKFA